MTWRALFICPYPRGEHDAGEALAVGELAVVCRRHAPFDVAVEGDYEDPVG